MNVITAKHLETACFRRLQLERELHIRPIVTAKPLRVHEAFTLGLKHIDAGMAPDASILAAVEGYTSHEYRSSASSLDACSPATCGGGPVKHSTSKPRTFAPTCPYFDLCSGGFDPGTEDLPEGYTLTTNERI